ncbi:hypothetical protein [Bacillus sp. B15-48]|uniref:capping complex subunit for YIEGIA n=1 Tax=Bacillus sp. B15-48 TaxID=1548601 RepID=UPI00193F939F|nr:hypothetical protein [Bacillus sp. B15-48]MBM4763628.1 hypothetical protein [Bacillus sp. B15-48]
MSKGEGGAKGILAYITTDKSRHIGGAPLAILAKDEDELIDISNAIAEAFLANLLQLKNGDCLVIKK